MSPLREFKTCSRVGGPAQSCTLCGQNLLMQHCTAVQVGGSNSKPVFVYFCRSHAPGQIRDYVLTHGKEPAEPLVEEESP
jgi:hypothetical protein